MSLNGLNAESLDHAIEIENVIGKMVIAAGAHPAAIAMAAAVGSDDPQRSCAAPL